MLFTALDRHIHLASAARLITECRACIPGRRVYHQCSMENAAMPKPIGDALDKRRELMDAWASFVMPKPDAKVVPIKMRAPLKRTRA